MTPESLFEACRETLPADERPDLAGAFSFGDTPSLANTLADLVHVGKKTATTEAKWTFEASDEPLRSPVTTGSWWTATGSYAV